MSTRLVVWGGVWAAVSVAAFLLLDPVLAAFVAILGLCAWVVALLSADWDRHSSFEERELARARRRAARREKNAGARARDRARWEAHQQRKAGRSRR
ncbi:hypothetical protein [Geodermatophilus sabuli]|uniref:Uncharacterized protein n=1 Tax=Geodermatophilus sabuli TaxID=1564158 RepID=A0A285EFZ8_9ACTN|nr:hypothetical protein [Geodermatophilus sabuli]MBB3086585.1 hypothetical protein [Geodermatophilus sabuli]SNX97763.1 hypothetical protein SAMN06893097_108128 [Geodermatophilus sabuli]